MRFRTGKTPGPYVEVSPLLIDGRDDLAVLVPTTQKRKALAVARSHVFESMHALPALLTRVADFARVGYQTEAPGTLYIMYEQLTFADVHLNKSSNTSYRSSSMYPTASLSDVIVTLLEGR